ncbi:MAG: hypothetical protein PHV23_05780 [Candidatus Gracilibacteria bacterium]|nr:hypothetical protein [Candidatus Gracilibacteria bacterium]
MKKIYFLFILATLVITSCSSDTTTNTSSLDSTIVTTSNQPDRKMDIYGKIISMEGNEITLSQVDTSKDPTFNMTTEEKKKYMASLDDAERTSLKEEINSAILGEVKITVPVGIAMTKKTAQGADAPNVEASLADLKVGGYLSIWLNMDITDKKIADFVKVSFVQ